MTRFIGIVSGKGGVGKTTTALNLSIALRNTGKDVILIDGNLTTPDISVRLGTPNLPVTLHHVAAGKNSIFEAMYKHPSGVVVVPGDLNLASISQINSKTLKRSINKLHGAAEFVLIDMPAGFENLQLWDSLDEVLVVTNPEIAAVTNALKSIKIAEGKNKLVLGAILNRVTEAPHEMTPENVQSLLNTPLITIVPESPSNATPNPIVFSSPASPIAQQYARLAEMLK